MEMIKRNVGWKPKLKPQKGMAIVKKREERVWGIIWSNETQVHLLFVLQKFMINTQAQIQEAPKI